MEFTPHMNIPTHFGGCRVVHHFESNRERIPWWAWSSSSGSDQRSLGHCCDRRSGRPRNACSLVDSRCPSLPLPSRRVSRRPLSMCMPSKTKTWVPCMTDKILLYVQSSSRSSLGLICLYIYSKIEVSRCQNCPNSLKQNQRNVDCWAKGQSYDVRSCCQVCCCELVFFQNIFTLKRCSHSIPRVHLYCVASRVLLFLGNLEEFITLYTVSNKIEHCMRLSVSVYIFTFVSYVYFLYIFFQPFLIIFQSVCTTRHTYTYNISFLTASDNDSWTE